MSAIEVIKDAPVALAMRLWPGEIEARGEAGGTRSEEALE
jgi:hypothetical protein